MFRLAASEFHVSKEAAGEAKALSAASQASLALGDYAGAIVDAQEAAALRSTLKDDAGKREDLNTLGLANLYSGRYTEALFNYQQALRIDVVMGSTEGEIARWNNIGNVYFFQGRYSDALSAYNAATDRVNRTTGENWNERRRQLTTANLATLYQKIGKEQIALDMYRQLATSPQAMPINERAQLLLNQGVLYRRLGDPVKALELYRSSQSLFAQERHRDGEIGALRNIGTVQALDLNDLEEALQSFTSALRLATESSNARGIAQAKLYRGEVLRRLHRLNDAELDARDAIQAAKGAGLIEEQWMAQLALGKVAELEGHRETARDAYAAAVAAIESVRAGLGVSMRSEFLSDKREAYDALVLLELTEPHPSVAELYRWIERSRARTLLDRVRPAPDKNEPSVVAVQAQLGPETVLLDFWVSSQASAVLWITNSSAGLVRYGPSFEDALARLVPSLQQPDEGWRSLSRSLGDQLLAAVPLRRHVLVVPDGPLGAIPFEVLGEPGSETLLIEKHDITYLPSAQFVLTAGAKRPSVLPPWRRQLVAFGDPPVSTGDTFAGTENWQPLPGSAEEVAGIAHIVPGRSEIHLGADATKRHLMERRIAGVPLLHFSTHAIVDGENPDRSRILMAPDSPELPSDYLFEADVYNIDLHGVDLVTVSACDTARGKFISGEGVEAFSNAFLAAGAVATITSLWRVPDRSTAQLMDQLYYYLAQGQPKSEALRLAKIALLKSNTSLARPRYWAAFILTGDGWNPTRRVISWSMLIIVVAALLTLSAGSLQWRARRKRPIRAAPAPL